MLGTNGVGGNSSSHRNLNELSYSENTIKEQKKIDPQNSTIYENLKNLALQNGVVKSERNGNYFSITHPSKINELEKGAKYLSWFPIGWKENVQLLGWKLHISVHYTELEKAFDLAAPIIDKYGLCFKVVNEDECIRDPFSGGQITIFLEEQGQQAITEEDAAYMMKEIDAAFSEKQIRTSENDICPLSKPHFAAETITSNYFSISNDKVKPRLWCSKEDYRHIEEPGKHFNPLNHANPFCKLLKSEPKPFDPLDHFHSFEADSFLWSLDKVPFFYLTMYSYVREYTNFDALDEKSQQEFIVQFCLGNGANIDARFLKEPCRNSPEILLAVKQALFIMLHFCDSGFGNHRFLRQVISAQFSTQYPFQNSFKELLIELEAYANERDNYVHFTKDKYYEKPSLVDILRSAAWNWVEGLSEYKLITTIRKGHYYNAQVALGQYRSAFGLKKYKHLLHASEKVPAVQLALAAFYKTEDPARSEAYCLSALLSKDANYINTNLREYIEYVLILMKHQSLEQLEALSVSGHSLATIGLAIIYAHDVFTMIPGINKFNELPIHHHLACECLIKLQFNLLYSSVAAAVGEDIDAFDSGKFMDDDFYDD